MKKVLFVVFAGLCIGVVGVLVLQKKTQITSLKNASQQESDPCSATEYQKTIQQGNLTSIHGCSSEPITIDGHPGLLVFISYGPGMDCDMGGRCLYNNYVGAWDGKNTIVPPTIPDLPQVFGDKLGVLSDTECPI